MRAVDIVIVSNAKDSLLRQLTTSCISSLLRSESTIQFRVIVVESNTGVNYDGEGVKTLHPAKDFGYNAYLNLGRKTGNAPYVCLCNNDLIFEKNWASEIIHLMEEHPDILSASPYCRRSHGGRGIQPDSGLLEGYEVAHRIAGWCIFQQRKIYDIIGDLDEAFIFWYADNDYSETIKRHNIRHALVTTSYVNHLTSKTLQKTELTRRRFLTHQQKMFFEKKWGKLD
jgi:GT2 family glycosyltransferase